MKNKEILAANAHQSLYTKKEIVMTEQRLYGSPADSQEHL
jgi:hypothetical protein